MGYRVICCILIALCAACAPRPVAQDKASSDEWRLQNIEARFLEFQEAQKTQEAEVQAKVQQLDGELSSVRQELSETKEKAGVLLAETAALKEALRARQIGGAMDAPVADSIPMKDEAAPKAKSKVQSKSQAKTPSQPDATVEPAKAAETASAPEPMKEAAKETVQEPVTAPVPSAPAPVIADDSSGTATAPEKQYEEGLALVRAGDVEKGRKLLDDFIGSYPNHTLVPNALYWMGETYYHEKRYAQAVLTFKEVVRRFPKHDKSAAALLKVGFAYEMLGDKSNARFYLQTLTEDYPSTEPAEMARKRLASL